MTPSPKKIEPLKPFVNFRELWEGVDELREKCDKFFVQQQPPKGISVPGNPGVPTKHRESRENSSNLGKPQVRTLNSGRKLYQQGYKDGVEAEHICFHEELDKAREEMVKLIPSLRTGNGSAEENPFQFGQVIGWNEAIGTMIKNLEKKK